MRDVDGKIPPYVSPACQTDYSGLLPAYTFVGDREPFYCETLIYNENLQKAGISTHVDVYPTGFYAFDMLLPFRKSSRQAIEALRSSTLMLRRTIALRRIIGHHTYKNKKCDGREGHSRKVPIGKFKTAYREFYGKTYMTYTQIFPAFTVTAVEVFLMPECADLS